MATTAQAAVDHHTFVRHRFALASVAVTIRACGILAAKLLGAGDSFAFMLSVHFLPKLRADQT